MKEVFRAAMVQVRIPLSVHMLLRRTDGNFALRKW